MNTRIFSAFFIILILLLAPLAAQSQATLTVEGPDESRPFTLVDSALMEILASGDVIARVNEDVACPDETGPCDSCCPVPPACDSCCPTCPECECETNLNFSQFQISAGGTNYSHGQSFTITAGDQIQATWKAPGAFVCTATGLPGTANWNNHAQEAFSGNPVNVLTSSVTPSATAYNMRLTCENGPSTSMMRQVSVTVQEPAQQPSECQGIPSLQQASGGTLVRATDIVLDNDSNGFEYEAVFGYSFPGESGRQKRLRFFPNTYASMRFETPSNLNNSHNGTWGIEVLQGTFGGRRLLAISRCEGDFNVNSVGSQCIRSTVGSQSLVWRGLSSGWECPLQPNTQYYFNIVYTNAPVGTDPSEIQWECESDQRCGNTYLPSYSWSP